MLPSITAAGRALRSGLTTSVRLVETALEVADRLEPDLNAYLRRFDGAALTAARQADAELARGIDRGPLHGIPLGIKDNIATREAFATAQSRVETPTDWRGKDAAAVRALRESGAIIMGKTTLMEFGIGVPDPEEQAAVPRNPWDPDRWAGGSSSGSANGTASGLFFAALGTDTGGSIRIPAAYCGVTGLKPSYGRVSRLGTVPLGFSLDTIGPIARSADDCRILLNGLCGHDGGPVAPASRTAPATLVGTTLGVARDIGAASGADEEDEPWALIDDAITVLEGLGATVVDVRLPFYEELSTAALVSELAEAFAYHRGNLAQDWHEYGRHTRMAIASGTLVSAPDYVQAQRVRRVGFDAMTDLFRHVDGVITPTVSQGSPALPIASLDDIVAKSHTLYWNATGGAVVSCPIGFTRSGLPLSMQVCGGWGSDSTVLSIATAFQAATAWHTQSPPLSGEDIWQSLGIASD